MRISQHQKRVLVLTAGFGEGHNTAAKNWAEALRRLDPSIEVRVADLFRATGRLLSSTLEGLYSFAITNTPNLWRHLYNFADTTSFGNQKIDVFAPLRSQLAGILNEFKPDLIANTYPLYPHVIDRIRELHPEIDIPPVYTMVTDSVSINSVWFSAPSDHYFVADAATLRELESRGLPGENVTVTGFPVSPLLTEIPCELTADSTPPRILYFPCTSGRDVRRTLAEIPRCLRGRARWTLVLGHHERRLYHTVRRFTDANPDLDIEVLGWSEEVPRLMRTHHIVIGKAGGATVHEALTARCPMIVNYVVPGQEEGNAELLERHGCAIRTRSPSEIPAAVEAIIGRGGKWQRMREAAIRLREPLPAARVAQIVLERMRGEALVPNRFSPEKP